MLTAIFSLKYEQIINRDYLLFFNLANRVSMVVTDVEVMLRWIKKKMNKLLTVKHWRLCFVVGY